MPAYSDTLDSFLDYFSVEPALTAEQQRDAGRLRHRVYCEEFRYEPMASGRIETDSHDAHSLHCLVRHRRSGLAAGCVRLICASENRTLALEDYCLGSLHLHYMDTLADRRERVCEFSRLATAPVFRGRRRAGDSGIEQKALADCGEAERYCFPLVTTATFLSAFASADLAGRSQIFGMMEASLPRLLRRVGINVLPAGDFMDYHGRRAPHFITVADAVAGMHPEILRLYTRIHETLAARAAHGGHVAVA